MRRHWMFAGLAGLGLLVAGGCSGAAGVGAAPDIAPTTTTPAAVAAPVVPLPPPVIDVGDPSAARAPVPGAVAVPEPPTAELCSGGYVKKNTAPASITDAVKAGQVAHGPYADKDPSHYVEDELIPVELGGAPADPRNLWPQTPDMAAVKDREESHLRAEVCHGNVSLSVAQTEMLQDWGPLPKS